MGLKFLKWVEIIKAESEAVKRDAMYVLQKDAETCDVIFVDSKGRKRKASGLTLPQIEVQLARIDAANIDATAQAQWRNVLSLYTKAEVDGITNGLTQAISDEQQARTNADEALQQSLSDETTARQSADTTLQQNIDAEAQARIAGDANLQQNIDAEIQARIAGDANLQQNIDAEIQARIAGDADLAQNHSDLQVVVNALKTWKDAMTNEDEDNLVNTLNEMLAVMASVPEGTNIYAVLASKVNTADIVNDLTSSLTNAPLSAYQGSVLKGLIDGLQTAINNEAKSRADADNLKLDKPTTTITAPNSTYKWVSLLNDTGDTVKMLAGDLGKNIANSSLTSISGAGMTQGASYTWNVANYPFNITGLPDKSTDSTFNLMLTTNAAGQVAKSNGVQLMLGGMGAMTDAQKDAWRLANRKTEENYSLGQPRVDLVNPPIISNNESYIQYVSLIGINLFVDNVTPNALVTMKNETTGVEYTISNIQVFQSNTNILSFGLDWSQYPAGNYSFKVMHNGLTSIVNTNNILKVVSSISEVALPPLSWEYLFSDDSNLTQNEVLYNNGLSIINQFNSVDKFFKTTNAVLTKDDINAGVVIFFNVKMVTMDIDRRDGGYHIFNIGFENINTPLSKNDIFEFGLNIGPVNQQSVPYIKTYRVGNIIGGFNSSYAWLDFNDNLFFMIKDGNITMGIISLGIIFSTSYDLSILGDLGLKITAKTREKKELSINLIKKYTLQ